MNASSPDKTIKLEFATEASLDDGGALVVRVKTHADARCASCHAALCPHEILASIALGAGHAPRCAPCLARTLEQSEEELASSMEVYTQGRACYQTAWNWATTAAAESRPN